MGKYTDIVTNYIYKGKDREFKDASVEMAKYCFMDWMAAVVSGIDEECTIKARKLYELLGNEAQSSVIGQLKKYSVASAAMINGVAASAIDYDDIVSYEPGHVTAAVISSSFALAEYGKSSGKELINAIITGIQVMNSVGAALMPLHYKTGWHNTGTMGHFGALAGCGTLIELTEEEVRNGLGIISSYVSSTHDNFGTMAKPLHSGKAAMSGVTSSLLAKDGFTASEEIFDGLFLEKYSPEVDRERMTEFLEGDDIIKLVRFKGYPCGVATHPSIMAVRSIMEEDRIAIEDIESIDAHVYPTAFQCAAIRHPQTGLEGKFSIYYCIAHTLVNGNVTLDSFTDDNVKDQKIIDIIGITNLHERKDFLESRGTLIEMKLKDGSVVSREVHMKSAFEDIEGQKKMVSEKFLSTLERIVDKGTAAELKDLVMNMEIIKDVNIISCMLDDGIKSKAVVYNE